MPKDFTAELFGKPYTFDDALTAEGVSGQLADVARSIYQQESASGANTKTSYAGAVGGMQVIPATFQRVADKDWDIKNPEHNLRAGLRYLKVLYPLAGEDPRLTAAGYYGGEGAIQKAAAGVPLRDPLNAKAPDTLQYAEQVVSRIPKGEARDFSAELFGGKEPSFDDVKSGVAKGGISRTGSVVKGIKDSLIDAPAQLLYNAVPESIREPINRFNNYLADKTGLVSKVPEGGLNEMIASDEKAYQTLRSASGRTGFDVPRVIGNVGASLPLAVALPATAATLPGRIGLGVASGAAGGALQPVTHGDFWSEKGKQIGIGASVGGAIPLAGNAIAKVISPNAAQNAELAALKAAGIRPTIGQALGGAYNKSEEKLTSLPIFGDAIASQRRQAIEDFNRATINRAAAPVGAKVSSAGTEGVEAASSAVSAAYEKALERLGGVKFDAQFQQELTALTQLAKNLTPDMRNKFSNELKSRVIGRMSPSGGMTARTFKNVDSELGTLAKDYGKSAMVSEREFGDAIRELQATIRNQARRYSAAYDDAVRPADAAYAGMVRVEEAAKRAAAQGGVFTPGQLMMAVKKADSSVRGRAVAQGNAFMQDWATAGQNVLGNKYPDSGTAGRLLFGLATGAVHPAIPVGLTVGSGLYTTPIQQLAVRLASERPQGAKALADLVRETSPRLGAVGAVPLSSLSNQ